MLINHCKKSLSTKYYLNTDFKPSPSLIFVYTQGSTAKLAEVD